MLAGEVKWAEGKSLKTYGEAGLTGYHHATKGCDKTPCNTTTTISAKPVDALPE